MKEGQTFCFLFIKGGERIFFFSLSGNNKSFKPLIDHEVMDQDNRKITAVVI